MKKKHSKDDIIKELQSEVESLRTIISMMPGNVYWKDIKGFYLGCNSNLSDILNLPTPLDIIGKKDEDLLGEELAQKASLIDPIVIHTQQEQCIEETGFDTNGISATYLTRKTPLYNSKGKVKGILGVSFDITERKIIEEKLRVAKQKAEAANRAKSKFLAMISHELRTPLAGILGFAELIKQPRLEIEKQHEYIKHIADSGTYLLSLINSLLNYNKLETKKFELTLLPLNLKELIKSSMTMLTVSAQNKNLKLSLAYEKNAPELIISDSRILHQILINLIGNAIKFTHKGFITITIKCISSTADKIKLQISIEDSGIGIPVHEQKSIFKQFYQLGSVYTRKTSLTGTGLGLAIVKKLVKIIGGDIKVKSTPGKGSVFYFAVNFKKVSPSSNPWLPYAARVRILIVQDIHKKNNLHSLFSNTLHEFTTSKDSLNTLIAAHQDMQPFDIIIIDSKLKETDPSELLKKIQNQSELYQPMPALIDSPQSSQCKKNFCNLMLPLVKTDYFNFQNQLKNAWEKWQKNTKLLKTKTSKSKNPHVLLVEDNTLIQIIHKHMLEDLGCTVDITESATRALEMLANNYDMLFVDIGLPDIAGFELIKTIRSHKAIPQIPIIVLTGYSEEDERQRCLRAGANDVSVKPISKQTLENLINRHFKSS